MITLNRDSMLLWVVMAGSLLGYLKLNPPPYDWDGWMSLGIFILSTVAGKLATSPLKGAEAAKIGKATAAVVEAQRELAKAKDDVKTDV